MQIEDVRLSGRQYKAYDEPLQLRALPGGVLPTADWLQSLIIRGFGWHFAVGAFGVGITGGGDGTVIDLDQPEFGISVPDGWTMIPHDIRVTARPGLQTTDSHISDILLAVDRAAKWAGDGTVTTETPTNLITNRGSGCPLSAFSAATADITDPTLGLELAMATKLTDIQGTAATVNLMDLVLHYEPRTPPLIVGPAALYGYWGGSIAVVGFASVNFLAIPTSLFTDLM